MKRISVVCLLFAAAFALPAIDKNAKIVGGENAVEHEAPFVVTLQVDRNGNGNFRHTCGGSILNPTWILSAAHCVMALDGNGQPFEYQIIAGQHNLAIASGREQVRRVTSFEMHESFVPGPVVGPWDVAVLRLESPLTLIEGIVESINLPPPGQVPNGDVQLYGWGSTSQTDIAAIPDILQTVRKDIVPWELCREIVNQVHNHEPLHSSNVCTGPLDSHITACSGDSGGPIVQGGEGDALRVVGIASWISAFPCGAINAVSVYVRVSAFNDWINARVNQ